MEDVSSKFSAPRNKYNLLANGTISSNKKSSFTKNINQGTSFSMTESDEECAGIFKQAYMKPTKEIVSLKKKTPKELKNDQPKKENNDVVMDSLDADGSSTVENFFQVDLNDKRTSDKDEADASCAVNENVNQPWGLLTECQFTNKSASSLDRNFLDSGYNSFSDEPSLFSSLFLPFEEELCIANTDDRFYNCYSLTKEVLANVERFLSHSPPPLSGLSDLEYEIAKHSALENLLYPPCKEYLQNDKSACLMSQSAINSQQNLEFNSLKFINHSSEKSCLYNATDDKITDEPNFCDSDDKVHKNSKNENLVSINHTQINIGPPKHFVEENNCVDNSGLPILLTDQDKSLPLFEDVNTEFNDVRLSLSNSKCKSLHVSDKIGISKMTLVSQFSISDELLLDNSEPQNQIVYDTNSWKSHEDLTGLREEKLKSDEYVFDYSKDLFSVTFDLGFCSPDSDDEILAHASDANKNTFLGDLSGRCFDIKEISDTNCVSKQVIMPRDHVRSYTSRTITISSSEDKQNPTSAHFLLSTPKNKQFMSPGYSQFSLPVREKVVSTPLFESNTLDSFSEKRKEMPRTSDSNKGKVNLQSFKETLNSTFDDSGLPIEKAKSREEIYLHQSYHSAGGKILSL